MWFEQSLKSHKKDMSYWVINLIFVLFLFYFVRTNRQGLHIFQLEHYYKDRYLKWVKQNRNVVFNIKKIALIVISALILMFKYIKIGSSFKVYTSSFAVNTMKA